MIPLCPFCGSQDLRVDNHSDVGTLFQCSNCRTYFYSEAPEDGS